MAENSYQVNGLNITNFRDGMGSSFVPMEFVQEVQVKTGGYEADKLDYEDSFVRNITSMSFLTFELTGNYKF